MSDQMRVERTSLATIVTRSALAAAAGLALVAMPAPTPMAGAAAPAALARPGDGRGTPHGELFGEVAELLGLSPMEVGTRLRDGESLAEIAADQGVGQEELTATIEEAISDLLDRGAEAGRLTAIERDAGAKIVAARVDDLIAMTPADARAGRMRPPAVIAEVADLLGLSPRELGERLRGGESLAEMAEAEGVAEAEVVALIEAAALSRLAEIAAPADLTEAEQRAVEALVAERVERLVELEPTAFRGPGGWGHDDR